MDFEIDIQTKRDLEIFTSSEKRHSLVSFFNQGVTIQSKDVLLELFSHPITDLQILRDRYETIAFFQANKPLARTLKLHRDEFDFIEHYLKRDNIPTRRELRILSLEKAIRNSISMRAEYYTIKQGIQYMTLFLHNLLEFVQKIELRPGNSSLKQTAEKIGTLLRSSDYKILWKKKKKQLKAFRIADLDYFFRYQHTNEIRYMLDWIYYLDVMIAVGNVAEKHGFCLPDLREKNERIIDIENLFHPYLSDPVKNDIYLSASDNVAFISGPNMAGKSTFLKSIGIAVFLTHIGFPVPATRMRISLLKGLYTTINLSDQIDLGYSHFYAEVRRVKTIAERLREKPDMLVIFDELFRGTNVKDAFDGTLEILTAFSRTDTSFHIVSTHIVEIAEALQEKNIQFLYLETLYEQNMPRYTYRVKKGISAERLGIYIIHQEKILDTIGQIKPS